MKTLFYRCETCGNLVMKVHDGGGQLVCCGSPMTELKANSTDAATEKHVPAVTRDGNAIKVQVGSTPHPMLEEHYIMWIAAVQEGKRAQIAYLKPGGEPKAEFAICDGPVEVYEYCNLHGLWIANA